MGTIKLPDTGTSTVSIHISSSLLADIDNVLDKLKKLSKKPNLSRNQLVELMLQHSRENAKIQIGDKEMTFDEILKA